MKVAYLFLLFFVVLNGCKGQVVPEGFPYELSKASKINSLTKELHEISGLSFSSKHKLYCIQDEKGTVYSYDLKKNKIVREIDFGKDNDFEGVALVGKKLYALKSNGTLYRIKNFNKKDDIKVEKITTFLDEKYDTEGLCYDKVNNQLLIACKRSPNKTKDVKHIYSFNLETKKLDKKPYLKINIDDVHLMKQSSMTQKGYDKVMHKSGGNNTVFNPSGIAIHPLSNDIYILSAEGNTLVVLDEDGEMLYATHLKKSLFKQPEGITFDSKGTMYISNEGHGEKATIKSFKYKIK